MSDLILGWQLTPNLDPKYWLSDRAKSGSQSDADLFRVAADSIGAHTAIIAQSGSGKSFFLGRLLEEIALRTQARCVVLDPNADFRQIHRVESDELWRNAKYNVRARAGKLTHEVSQSVFADSWKSVTTRIRGGRSESKDTYRPLRVPWPSVSAEFLAEDLGPVQRSELANCHTFVRIIHDLFAIRSLRRRDNRDYLKKAESLLGQATFQPSDFVNTMREDLGIDEPSLPEDPHKMSNPLWLRLGLGRQQVLSKRVLDQAVDRQIESALNAARYVSEDTRRFYFGKLSGFRSTNVIETRVSSDKKSGEEAIRIDVIDLPSIASAPTRLLAMNAVVQSEWDSARAAWDLALAKPVEDDRRVPVFLVIDEAHNVVPRDPRTRAEHALREQFRTIIAEGRKYGLFLLLVSQRPDKLDPLVVSECENRAIMKLSSRSALESTRQMLSLEEIPDNVLAKCLELPIGRALMVGGWSANGPEFMYAAARRTVEGGRNLPKAHWTSAPIIEPKSPDTPDSREPPPA